MCEGRAIHDSASLHQHFLPPRVPSHHETRHTRSTDDLRGILGRLQLLIPLSSKQRRHLLSSTPALSSLDGKLAFEKLRVGSSDKGGADAKCAWATQAAHTADDTPAEVRATLVPPCAGRDWGVGRSAVHSRVHGGQPGQEEDGYEYMQKGAGSYIMV